MVWIRLLFYTPLSLFICLLFRLLISLLFKIEFKQATRRQLGTLVGNHINDIHGLVHTLLLAYYIWKKLGLGRFYLPVPWSSFDYTHDVLLRQPCMCNNNNRVARLNMPYKVSKNNFIPVLEISHHSG